jgi:hypothetical protein
MPGLVSMNIGMPLDAIHSSKKKRPIAEEHLRTFAEKCTKVGAGVIQLQEISPLWLTFFLSALPAWYVQVPRDDDAIANYVATVFDSRQWKLESSRSYKPLSSEVTGKNFIH